MSGINKKYSEICDRIFIYGLKNPNDNHIFYIGRSFNLQDTLYNTIITPKAKVSKQLPLSVKEEFILTLKDKVEIVLLEDIKDKSFMYIRERETFHAKKLWNKGYYTNTDMSYVQGLLRIKPIKKKKKDSVILTMGYYANMIKIILDSNNSNDVEKEYKIIDIRSKITRDGILIRNFINFYKAKYNEEPKFIFSPFRG